MNRVVEFLLNVALGSACVAATVVALLLIRVMWRLL